MEKPSLEITEHQIVLLGSFNTAIFHPQWMARKGIISEGEASGAEIKVSHNEISEFYLESCQFQVLPERFTLTSKKEAYYKYMRDLVLNIFGNLRETPIFKMGLNHRWHFKFKDSDSWHQYGHKHAPKEPFWSKILSGPGLSQLSIQGRREDGFKGLITVSTGISNIISIKNFGVMIQVNDHYDFDIETDKKEIDANSAIEVIEKNWDTSREKCHSLYEEIVNYGCS